MNEEISLNLTNNTNIVQPVSLFTEVFAIPNNISSYGFWDVSNQSFNWGLFVPPTAQIQIDTSPITNATPYTITNILPTLNADGLVTVLNALGQGLFTNNNNIITVQQQNNNFGQPYFYGTLLIEPIFVIGVQSTIPNGVIPALTINISPVGLIYTLPSGVGTNVGISQDTWLSGSTVTVQYSAGVTSVGWQINIINALPDGNSLLIYNDFGVGNTLNSHIFIYPQIGNIIIQLDIF